jgi:hypothetical protein
MDGAYPKPPNNLGMDSSADSGSLLLRLPAGTRWPDRPEHAGRGTGNVLRVDKTRKEHGRSPDEPFTAGEGPAHVPSRGADGDVEATDKIRARPKAVKAGTNRHLTDVLGRGREDQER